MIGIKIKTAAAVMAAMVGLGGGVMAASRRAHAGPKDPPPEIQAAKLKALHEMIKPGKGECQWLEIPWEIGIQAAREKAAKEGKPMLLWRAANGHPLGST